MTVLCITLAIFALIFLIVFSSIKIFISYDNEIKLTISFLFLRFRILPSKPSKNSKKSKADIKSKSQDNKKGSVTFKIGEIIDIVKCIIDCLKPVLKAVRIKPLKLDIIIADGDAAATAIKTGAVNAVVCPFAGWLASTVKVSKQAINIAADYNGNNSVKFKTCIYIRLNHIIAAGFNILAAIYKLKFNEEGA